MTPIHCSKKPTNRCREVKISPPPENGGFLDKGWSNRIIGTGGKKVEPPSRQERQVLKKTENPSSLVFLGGLAVEISSLSLMESPYLKMAATT